MKHFNIHKKFWSLFTILSFIASVFLLIEYINLPENPSASNAQLNSIEQADIIEDDGDYQSGDLNLIKNISQALEELFSKPF